MKGVARRRGSAAGSASASGTFQSDRASEPPLTDAQLRAQAADAGQERTYLCVPPGSGVRVGIDRDEDGFFDRDEIDAGSDPADPSSTPGGGTTTTSRRPTTSTTTTTTSPPAQVFVPIPTKKLTMKDRSAPPADPSRRKVSFKSDTKGVDAPVHITPPFPGDTNDPRIVGATIAVYNSVALGRRARDRRAPGGGMARDRTERVQVQGRATDAITRGDVQARPDRVQGRQGGAGATP